ncbi:helix-turn-helix domain-containing protein [Mycobacterium avium]|uniref:helix-turn-helix domain-containing protein n=1 Tax=Mycobacterium avium TaxID=1764 RepID=UPI0020C761ED|nr:helix-turn-helix domain-containing protein [Mycobacterium avium]
MPYAGVPCWTGTQRWAQWTVPVAYDLRYDTDVRPPMGANQISRARCCIAEPALAMPTTPPDGTAGPATKRLATDTGYDVRTIQRASTVLRLLGVATEVLRGRQRTRIERLASWRVGDRGRGWASVWALHDHRLLNRVIHKVQSVLSPHPRSGPVRDQHVRQDVVTTTVAVPAPATAAQRAAHARWLQAGPGQDLARAHPQAPMVSPAQSHRLGSATLPRRPPPALDPTRPQPAHHRLARCRSWIPDTPHKPIGLLRAIRNGTA